MCTRSSRTNIDFSLLYLRRINNSLILLLFNNVFFLMFMWHILCPNKWSLQKSIFIYLSWNHITLTIEKILPPNWMNNIKVLICISNTYFNFFHTFRIIDISFIPNVLWSSTSDCNNNSFNENIGWFEMNFKNAKPDDNSHFQQLNTSCPI